MAKTRETTVKLVQILNPLNPQTGLRLRIASGNPVATEVYARIAELEAQGLLRGVDQEQVDLWTQATAQDLKEHGGPTNTAERRFQTALTNLQQLGESLQRDGHADYWAASHMPLVLGQVLGAEQVIAEGMQLQRVSTITSTPITPGEHPSVSGIESVVSLVKAALGIK